MDKNFLLDYLKTDSPSSFEVEAQKLWIDKVKNYCSHVETDYYGNADAIVSSINPESFNVVLDAHCDEISWIVSRITDGGFIYVKRNGGTDNDLAPGTKVKILTESGKKVSGFFGSVPIHLKHGEKDTKMTEDNIFIDISTTSKEEVEERGVEIGNYVVVDRTPEIIDDKYVVGKSVDDKIGGFILFEVLKKLKEEKVHLGYNLHVVNSVQEELGLRGAKMITDKIKPEIAICFDVTFDTNTPMISKDKHGDFKMGEGLVFRQGRDVHPKLLGVMKDVAKEKEIPYKIRICNGGTNTTSYNLSNGGVVTSTLSIPLRYMHSPNETVSLDDVQHSINYLVELLKKLNTGNNFKLV